ncbi:MAG: cytochrome c biogenesis protein CcsA, partial [Actinomycetia bacterium]|nr:cytochrome c biogenesis protein CcsA [Actinomycetes bacterium]
MTDGGSMSLAEASNAAIYATMVTLTVAMVLFAASFASGRRRTTSSSSVASRETAEGSVAVIDRVDTAVAAEPGRRLANVAMSLTWLATGLLTVGLVLRGLWAGRVPWGNMYEFSISSAWGVLVVFLVLSTRRDLRWLGLFVVTPALLTLGLAVTVLYTEAAQLVPALKSYWLVIHVSAAIICAGAFTVAASAAALSLVQSRREQRGLTWQGVMASTPSTEKLQTFTSRIIAFAFPLWTFAVIAGAIWAE